MKEEGAPSMTNEEAFQSVINNLMKSIPAEFITNEQPVSKSFLKATTNEELDYTKVIAENNELSEKYNYLVKAYGFNSFYDLYLYADSCDSFYEQLEKGGQKDLSKLKRVTRTVMRNGKPMKTTIYEDSNGEENGKNPLDKGQAKPDAPQPRKAKDLSMSFIGDDETGTNPKQVSQLAKEAKKLDGTFISDCSSFMILQGEAGDLGGVAGFRKEGNYLYLVFYQADQYTSGVAYRAFYQLLLRAWKSGLGAKIDYTEDSTAQEIFKEYGLSRTGDCYKISASNLKKALGNR